MPYIDVHIAAETVSEEVLKNLSTGIADVMSEILRKNPALVAVSVETISPYRWFVAGHRIDPDQNTTAFVTARITEGTNTEVEKGQAIKAINKLLSDELGILEEASYIVLQSIPAEDWGYSGQTQKSRQSAIRRLENGAIDTAHYLRKSRQIRSITLFEFFKRILSKFRRQCPVYETKTSPVQGSPFTG